MWLVLLLFIFLVINVTTIQVPKNLTNVQEKYTIFLKNVPKKWSQLTRRSILTGFHNRGRELGYNVNKGYEIGLCVDGTTNEMFHVLIHELAHSTVDEFSHSEQFWKNFQELKSHCIDLGIYQEIPEQTKFCGKYISD